MNSIPEVETRRLSWSEQFRALAGAARSQVRRLFRREPRFYLMVNGLVLARFESEQAELEFREWVGMTHEATFHYGFQTGKEFLVAQHINAADAGEPRTQ